LGHPAGANERDRYQQEGGHHNQQETCL
jgi:hypothetical protein